MRAWAVGVVIGAGMIGGAGCGSGAEEGPKGRGARGEAPREFLVATFNTGTTPGLPHDAPPDDGYTSIEAERSDAWYGDGLAWRPAIDGTAAFLADLRPDLIAFQEIFSPTECPSIPADQHPGFACEGWRDGDPTVAQQITGADYQIACHPDKPDKCLAVRSSFGTLRGCGDPLCLDGLDGTPIEGCGGGARVARATIDLAEPGLVPGDVLTVVSVHGSSGVGSEDVACRIKQVDQVFVDLGDGAPGVRGPASLVLGDLNTDPGRFGAFDASAEAWASAVAEGPLDWVTEVGEDAPLTYQGLASIDHIASDVFSGPCIHFGLDDMPPVLDAVYFDHSPAVCNVTVR